MKKPKSLLHFLLGTVFFSFFSVQTFAQSCPTLVWQDEFSGNSIDPTKWNIITGNGCSIGLCGWGNNELQSYQAANLVVSNGTLKINARQETVGGMNYTSGKLDSKNLGTFTYGRYEARMKLPNAKGLWPAFWMLSNAEPYGTWPKSGEIDIMEYVATNSNKTLGYIHYGDFAPNNKNTGKVYTMPIDISNDFHVWAVEWDVNVIRWYIDGVLFSTKTNADVSPSAWPFDHPFYILLTWQ